MDCTKCEYYKAYNGWRMFVCDKCINCNVLFPWLEESQFKAKEICINRARKEVDRLNVEMCILKAKE